MMLKNEHFYCTSFTLSSVKSSCTFASGFAPLCIACSSILTWVWITRTCRINVVLAWFILRGEVLSILNHMLLDFLYVYNVKYSMLFKNKQRYRTFFTKCTMKTSRTVACCFGPGACSSILTWVWITWTYRINIV